MQEADMSVDKDINVVDKACPMPLIARAREVRNLKKG
jgi:TusA-related sulfurtransferase